MTSRATSSTPSKRKKISHEEKDRLLRIGKRPRRGPFNAIIDATEAGAGSALLEMTEAVKQIGKCDVWQEAQKGSEEEGNVVHKTQAVKVCVMVGVMRLTIDQCSFYT